MKRLALCYFLSAIAAAAASDRITAHLTVTNAAVGLDTITVNGSTRTVTNNVTAPATQFQVTNSAAATKTNLLAHLRSYPPGTYGWFTGDVDATNITIQGPVGTNFTVTFTAGWATNYYTTNKYYDSIPVVVPAGNVTNLQTRTNIASGLVEWLSSNPTNQIVTNSPAVGGLMLRTNGYGTNQVFDSPTLTNGVNRGNAFRSPGGGTGSEQIGEGASASTNYATAIGFGAQATNSYATAIGAYSIVSSNEGVALGYAATVQNTAGIAIGSGSASTSLRSIAIGAGAESTHMDSVALGTSVTTTRTNEIRLGGSQDVVIGGLLSVEGMLSNNAARITGGTLTNVSGAFSSARVTNLYAHNAGLTNLNAEAASITATSLVAHAAKLTNANIEAATVTVTNLTAKGGSTTNLIHDRGFNTNATFAGANVYGGAVSYPRFDLSTLADGNNLAVPLGSNSFVKLTGTLTTTATLCGFVGAAATGGADGQYVSLLNVTGQNVVLSTGTSDPVPANRIISPTGGDITVSNLYSAHLIYDTGSSRWRILRENL